MLVKVCKVCGEKNPANARRCAKCNVFIAHLPPTMQDESSNTQRENSKAQDNNSNTQGENSNTQDNNSKTQEKNPNTQADNKESVIIDEPDCKRYVICPSCNLVIPIVNDRKPRKCSRCEFDEFNKVIPVDGSPVKKQADDVTGNQTDNYTKQNAKEQNNKEYNRKKQSEYIAMRNLLTDENLSIHEQHGTLGKTGSVLAEYFHNLRYVSRQHLSFEINNSKLYMTDIGSTNGTKYNGEVMEVSVPYEFKEGDILTLASTHKFRISIRKDEHAD